MAAKAKIKLPELGCLFFALAAATALIAGLFERSGTLFSARPPGANGWCGQVNLTIIKETFSFFLR